MTDGDPTIGALVGATGGAGTTRLTLEAGAILARDGRRVAAFDAALATQGMADHVEGTVDPDAVDLVTDDVSPSAAMVEADVAGGELHLCPARAPFADLVRAKTPGAARRFESVLREAGSRFDAVLVDVPPLAANQSIAAVDAADRVAVVTRGTDRGVDAAQRARGRVSDVGSEVDLVVANRTGDPPAVADLGVPDGSVVAPGEVPVCDEAVGPFPDAVADLAGSLFEADLAVDSSREGIVDRTLGR